MDTSARPEKKNIKPLQIPSTFDNNNYFSDC